MCVCIQSAEYLLLPFLGVPRDIIGNAGLRECLKSKRSRSYWWKYRKPLLKKALEVNIAHVLIMFKKVRKLLFYILNFFISVDSSKVATKISGASSFKL